MVVERVVRWRGSEGTMDRGSLARNPLACVLTVLLGIPTWLIGVAAVGVSVVRPALGRRVLDRAVALESARLGQQHGPAPGGRTALFLAGRTVSGPAGGLVVLVGVFGGLGYLVWPMVLFGIGEIGIAVLAVSLGVGVAALVLSWQLAVALVAVDRWLATRLLGADSSTALRLRVAELSDSRAAVVDAVDEERRRASSGICTTVSSSGWSRWGCCWAAPAAPVMCPWLGGCWPRRTTKRVERWGHCARWRAGSTQPFSTTRNSRPR